MRRWLLLAILLFVIVAGTVVHANVAAPTSRPHANGMPADTLLLGPLDDGVLSTPPMALGLGAGISDRLEPGMAHTLQGAAIAVLRFGDNSSDSYDWQSGCSYGDIGSQRECSGRPGAGGKLDRFLQLAGEVGARPLIVLNAQIDDPQQAADLVAYYRQHCVRRSLHDPCTEPYWEIGTAPAGWKHFAVPLSQRRPSDAFVIQPDEYAALVIAYAAAIARVDPSATIVADEWITGATDQSWIDYVDAIDTHYSPLLYASPGPAPTAQQIIDTVQQGSQVRPSMDSWLQDLRDSLAQFSNADDKGIIIGQWSIDANALDEPPIYGTYVQALFAAEMIAHFWRDAQPGGRNPLLMAIQYPITGGAQEPFDIGTGQPRAATAVYALIGRYFGMHPTGIQLGTGAQRAGIVAAAALLKHGLAAVLLVNTSRANAYTLHLRGVPAGPCDMWWVVPDTHAATGVSAVHHLRTAGDHVTLPPWAIAVIRSGRP